MNRRKFLKTTGTGSIALGLAGYMPALANKTSISPFHFDFVTDTHVVADYEGYGPGGTLRKVVLPHVYNDNVGPGKFLMISGDLDVFHTVNDAVQDVLVKPLAKKGQTYGFYPAMGNHDFENASTRDYEKKDGANTQIFWKWMRDNQTNVNWSKSAATNLKKSYGSDGEGLKYLTYSWDYENCHFITLNLYGDNANPYVLKYQYDWLKADLEATNKEHIFIQAHQPVFPNSSGIIDKDYKQTGLSSGHCVKNADFVYNHAPVHPINDFWALLKKYPVRAYLCGHAHIYTAEEFDGIWQISGGGSREEVSTAGNTYTRIFVDGGRVTWKTYRLKNDAEYNAYEGVMKEGTTTGVRKLNNGYTNKSSALRIKNYGSGMQITVSESGLHTLEIIDAKGVVRVSKKRNNSHTYTISHSQLPQGMYVVRMKNATGIVSDVMQILN